MKGPTILFNLKGRILFTFIKEFNAAFRAEMTISSIKTIAVYDIRFTTYDLRMGSNAAIFEIPLQAQEFN